MRRSMQRGWLAVCLVVAGVGVLPMLPAVANGPDEVGSRLRRLEDLEKIKALKHRYVAALDDLIGDPAAVPEFVDLFVNNLEVEYDAYGTFTDKASLTAFLQNVISPAFAWGFHVAANPRIHIHGDVATAEWYLVAQALPEGGAAVVPFYGRYVDDYVRTNAGWKIKKSVLVFDPPPLP